MKYLSLILIFCVLSGCARIDPFSPKQKQTIENQNGKIDEVKNNQQGFNVELGKLRSQQEIVARDMEKVQTGMMNKQNTGVQILQGDGALITVVLILIVVFAGVSSIIYYKNQAAKNKLSSEILAGEIAKHPELEEKVLMAALHSKVESDVYHLVKKFSR